jgi:hypothetical protein
VRYRDRNAPFMDDAWFTTVHYSILKENNFPPFRKRLKRSKSPKIETVWDHKEFPWKKLK